MEYKKYLKITINQFEKVLDHKQQELEKSTLYEQEKKNYRGLLEELMKVKQAPLEIECTLQTGIDAFFNLIMFYSEKVENVDNHRYSLTDVERDFNKTNDNFLQLNNNLKNIMPYTELRKLKEVNTNELSALQIKIDAMQRENKNYHKTLSQLVSDYQEITENVKNFLNYFREQMLLEISPYQIDFSLNTIIKNLSSFSSENDDSSESLFK